MKKYNKDFYFYKKIDVRECSEKQKEIIIDTLEKLQFRIDSSLKIVKINNINYLYIYKDKVTYGNLELHYLTHPNSPIPPKLFFPTLKDKLK